MPGEKRTQPRNPAEAQIACCLLTTRSEEKQAACTLRNYSPAGVYIESQHCYNKGAVVVVRIFTPAPSASEPVAEEEIPSVALAEVRWVQALQDNETPCFGIGLKYLP